jgi:flavodoxin
MLCGLLPEALEFPMSVFTFLESYDFSGKMIVPFCTHEGSGMGNSEKDIVKACPKATVLEGIAIHGTNASSADSKVSAWIDKPYSLILNAEYIQRDET